MKPDCVEMTDEVLVCSSKQRSTQNRVQARAKTFWPLKQVISEPCSDPRATRRWRHDVWYV